MNVSINFPDELEKALRLTAAAAGTDIGTFVKQIVAERLAEGDLPSDQTAASFCGAASGVGQVASGVRPCNR
ncbi:MAG: hypothetical protein JWP89_2444 [Schlesneria sp.]|nr:hypothetical protein [Schlesneria sp.]